MTTGLVAVLGRGLVGSNEPVVFADDLGFSRGDGCFETCRVVTDPAGRSAVHNLAAHMERLRGSLAQLEIDLDVQACEDLIEQVVTAWSQTGEASVRLVVSRGPESSGRPVAIATVRPISHTSLRQRSTGVRVVALPHAVSARAYSGADWLLGGVKTISYAINMAALREAERRGVDDAIWISTEGLVLEAPTATVIWSGGDSLLTTPAGATGILPGTTLGGLFEAAAATGYRTGTASVTLAELASAEAIWLASSVRGIVEVVELDGVARPANAELTAQVQKLAGF